MERFGFADMAPDTGTDRRGEAMERDVARCLGNLELGI